MNPKPFACFEVDDVRGAENCHGGSLHYRVQIYTKFYDGHCYVPADTYDICGMSAKPYINDNFIANVTVDWTNRISVRV